jgi:OMF family outer membrane factor
MRYTLSIFLIAISSIGFAQQKFISLQEILSLAEKNNYSILIAEEQNNLASLTTVSAYGNAFNPRMPLSASITDNSKLPVSFIPSEAFGGPVGGFKQLTMGQRYVSVLNFAPQFEILNFGSLAKIKSAKANELLTKHNALLNKKNLFDQVNACYHNIISFQSQINVLKLNKQKSDTLLRIINDKYNLGLVRKQDVNDAEINLISIKDKFEQAKIGLEQQYLTLKILCETEDSLMINQILDESKIENEINVTGNLIQENANLQLSFSKAEYKASLWNNLPVLSFITSFNVQNNSNLSFIDSKNPWIQSNFYSLKLSWDFPTNVPKITALKSNLIAYNIAQINAKHSSLQAKLQNEQLVNDYQKSLLQYQNNKNIYSLKLDNYIKSKAQFEANILSLDKLLLAHNDLLISELNVATGYANVSFNKSKIEINNQIK